MENKKEYFKRENRQCRYDKRLILDVVKLIEEGMPRREARQLYELGTTTLDCWMRDYGSLAYQEKKKRKFPPIDRRKIVNEIVQGRITVSEAKKKYDLNSVGTINNWIQKWRKQKLDICSPIKLNMAKQKQKSSSEITNSIALQKALEDAQLKIEGLNTMIDVAEQQLKINIRKKSGTKQ